MRSVHAFMLIGLAACSGGGTSEAASDGGSMPEPSPTAQAILAGALEGETCPDVGPLFAVGGFAPPSPVKDGEATGDATANVTCSVTPNGSAFTVSGDVTLSGPNGGDFRVAGTFQPSGETTGVHATISLRKTGNSYDETACTVRYATGSQGVGQGRVWAEIECPGTTCRTTAQFRFENCR